MNRSGGDISIADVYVADTASYGSDHKDRSRTYIFSVEGGGVKNPRVALS